LSNTIFACDVCNANIQCITMHCLTCNIHFALCKYPMSRRCYTMQSWFVG
jgi:hypothetical protein